MILPAAAGANSGNDLAEVRALADLCGLLVSNNAGQSLDAESLRDRLKEVYDAALQVPKFWYGRAKLLGTQVRAPRTAIDELIIEGVDTETIWQQLQVQSRSIERWSRAAEIWLAENGLAALENPLDELQASNGQYEDGAVLVEENVESESKEEHDEEDEVGVLEENMERAGKMERDEEDEGEGLEHVDDRKYVGKEGAESVEEDRFFSMQEMEDFAVAAEVDDDNEEGAGEDDEVSNDEDELSAEEGVPQELIQKKSAYEVNAALIAAKARELEMENVQDASAKRWDLRGEVAAGDRPENSLLAVDAEWDASLRSKRNNPLDPELTEQIEALIKERIAENRFDEVVSADLLSKAREEVNNKAVVQEDDGKLGVKSQMGLAEEYERDYVERREKGVREEAPKRDEGLDALWARLSVKLDALSHFDVAPQRRIIEDAAAAAKKSDLPAVMLEETTPSAVADGSMLPPEQIYTKKRGKDSTLRTSEEATTQERRAKRAAKKRTRNTKRKRLAADAQIIARLNPGLGNRHEREKLRAKLTQSVDNHRTDTFTTKNASSQLFYQLSEETRKAVRSQVPDIGDAHPSRDPRGSSSAAALKL